MVTHTFLPAAAALLQSSEGLTADEIVRGLPTDPASIFALLLIVACAGAVLWFGRPKGGGDKPA